LRLKYRYANLRNGKIYGVLRRVLLLFLDGATFRIVHISIQTNHLHLIVEAQNRKALSEGMRRFCINAARAINAANGDEGRVFAFRYHATQITTARHARTAMSYVLNNWRRHRRDWE